MKNIANYKTLIYSIVAFLLIAFSACQPTSPYDASFLQGQWKVSSWKILPTNEIRTNQMDMSFGADGNYEVDYGSEKEIGRYWLSNESLVTVENGKSEKSVKILMLNSDTLAFQMNRAGQLEDVILLKK